MRFIAGVLEDSDSKAWSFGFQIRFWRLFLDVCVLNCYRLLVYLDFHIRGTDFS